ncbi:MAG: TolC family protein [Flammeovirgaceae bacterium]|jgi:outer membrane protein, heavy metal efflux system|nr:TolC family protein [Flammeovirgaceae bacterium]|tara:strand:- start:4450 stop:5679 length:1230 start_codon:yes stop_codon:yes gene_type:complete
MKRLTTLLLLMALILPSVGQTLEDYLMIAAQNNPSLKATYHQFEAALEHIHQVGTLPDPAIGFGYFISPIETRTGPQRVKISLSQMLPWFGTEGAQKDVASLIAEAQFDRYLDQKEWLFYQVKANYYPIEEIIEIIDIHQKHLSIMTTYEKLAIIAYSNGKSTKTDILKTNNLLEEIRTNINILEGRLKAQKLIFNRLLNRDDSLEVIANFFSEPKETDSMNTLDSMVISHPRLDELTKLIEANVSNEQVAIKEGLPRLGIGLDYLMINKMDGSTNSNNGKDALIPMISMSLPVFRKKYQSRLNEISINQHTLTAKRNAVRNNLVSELVSAQNTFRESWEAYHLSKRQIENAQLQVDFNYKSYGNANVDFDELLISQSDLLKFKLMATTAKKNCAVAQAKIDYLLVKKL